MPTLRRVKVLCRHLPRGSALWREIHGEVVDWGPAEHLLALIADVLQLANWQRGSKKGASRPKPVERPKSKALERDTLERMKAARERSMRARERRRSAAAEGDHQPPAHKGDEQEQGRRPVRRLGGHQGAK